MLRSAGDLREDRVMKVERGLDSGRDSQLWYFNSTNFMILHMIGLLVELASSGSGIVLPESQFRHRRRSQDTFKGWICLDFMHEIQSCRLASFPC